MAEEGFTRSFWFRTVSESSDGVCCCNCVVKVRSLPGRHLIIGSKAEPVVSLPALWQVQACEAQPLSITHLSPNLPSLLSRILCNQILELVSSKLNISMLEVEVPHLNKALVFLTISPLPAPLPLAGYP